MCVACHPPNKINLLQKVLPFRITQAFWADVGQTSASGSQGARKIAEKQALVSLRQVFTISARTSWG